METIECPLCQQTLQNLVPVIFTHFRTDHHVDITGQHGKPPTCAFCNSREVARCGCERFTCLKHLYNPDVHICHMTRTFKIKPKEIPDTEEVKKTARKSKVIKYNNFVKRNMEL